MMRPIKLKQLPKATFQLKMLYILDEPIFDQFFSWSCLKPNLTQKTYHNLEL